MTARDQEEQDLRITKMQADIDKSRLESDKIRRDMSNEVWRLTFQLLAALGTAAVGGAAAATLVLHLLGKF